MNSYFASPLRYPGGKIYLHKFFSSILKINQMKDCTYVEPFAGGAGVALKLLFNEYVNKIVLNDADYSIYCFWKTILKETEKFKKKIKNVKVSVRNWKIQKNILDNPNKHSAFEIGFATFFLNRCNRSGIINARPIGGLNQKGKWKIDARFNRNDLINRIDKIALYKDRIKVFNKDAIKFLNDFSKKRTKNCFIYLDPPYFVKGKELYLNYYDLNNHMQLSKYMKSIRHKWVMTYDNCYEIKKLYNKKRVHGYSLNYSAHLHKKGEELMIFSDNLIVPEKICFFN